MRSFCRACQRKFRGVQAFDRHRVGSYGDPKYNGSRFVGYTAHTRRCLTPEEIQDVGLIENGGLWGFPIPERDEEMEGVREATAR